MINNQFITPIQNVYSDENEIYIKREDLIPFSFGGNKARKGMLFLKDLEEKKADYILTYGSNSSNHCRVIANIAASKKIPCCIISPIEIKKNTFNKEMMELFNAEIMYCTIDNVPDTIQKKMEELSDCGFNPYFIIGGGHGNIGTQAYVDCYEEIIDYETNNGIEFDYIFHASGTGTTQAGLVCGKLLNNKNHKIVGISIAREENKGKNIIKNSIEEYLDNQFSTDVIEENILFTDKYIFNGYGQNNAEINEVIEGVMVNYGIPLDETYTGKAYLGMKKYLEENKITNKKVLFIHTGGSPLFFDYLSKK